MDGTDLGLLINNMGASGATWAMGDLNSDGSVDGTDLGLLINNMGNSISYASPTTIARKPGLDYATWHE